MPDPEVLPSWAQKKGFEGCYDDLCGNKVRLDECLVIHTYEETRIASPQHNYHIESHI